MSSSAGSRHPRCHVLDFFYDSSLSSALTVLQNGIRFHIIADHKNFSAEDESGPIGRLTREYNRLVTTIRDRDEREHAEAKGKRASSSSSKDSGVDMKTESTSLRKGGFQMDGVDVEQELQNWLLLPFAETFEELAPASKKPEKPTVHEWYNGPTHFFDVKPDENGELAATELESESDLQECMKKLMPAIDVPKYIKQMDVPHFKTTELTVIGETVDPDPRHSCIVEDSKGRTYFMKSVEGDAPQVTHREIKLLKRVEKIGLGDSINVPQVFGLVYSKDSPTKVVAFLQTNISKPTPLTKMLDEDVSQRKRDRWAKEVERTKEALHENDIVFGDMKADNFLVDEDEKLWIIDFGGSYTEGWVDPELNETEEGDDMGAEKIVNALHDPINNTQHTQPHPPSEQKGEKRKRSEACTGEEPDEDEDVEAKDSNNGKRRRTEGEAGGYCFCNEPDSGRMVACDNEECEKQWFHFECVGLEEAPAKNETWFCDECKA
jgi:hypothetical protein